MRIYIVRHGKANEAQIQNIACPVSDARVDDTPDFQRALSSRGLAQGEFLAQALKASSRPIAAIVSSRFPRAFQTAQTIATGLGMKFTTDIRLEVDHPVAEALTLIDEHRQHADVVLVGHNPQLGELLSLLCAGLDPMALMLKTGELVIVELRPGQGVGTGKVIDRVRLGDHADASPQALAELLKPTMKMHRV